MDEQQLQQQIVQLVQAAMLGDQQATQQIQQIMLAAQQGNLQAAQIAQMIQQVALQMQQLQVRAARFGAKLNYIKLLKGQCPDGYQMQYYKKGGQLCKRCMKAHQDGGEVEQTPNTVAGLFKMEAAKCGKKMNKKENGGAVEAEKCGGKPKLKKKACGGPMKIKKNQEGGDFWVKAKNVTIPTEVDLIKKRSEKEFNTNIPLPVIGQERTHILPDSYRQEPVLEDGVARVDETIPQNKIVQNLPNIVKRRPILFNPLRNY